MRLFSQPVSSNQIIAEYLWGRTTVVLPSESPLASDVYTRVVASTFSSKLLVQSDADFREFVGVIHELSHCLQEVATGLGMSDFVVRAEMVLEALAIGRDASYGRSQDGFAAIGNRYRRRSFVNTIGWGEDREVPLLQRKLAGLVKGDVSHFRVVDLLEAEATLSTYQTIRRMAAAPQQQEIRQRNRDLFDPLKSPHAATYESIALCFLPPGEARDDDALNLQHILTLVAPILLDLAFAVPPPQYLARHGLDPDDFHPGVRLVRMMAAYDKMDVSLEEVRDALQDWHRLYVFVEKHCRVTPQMEYPPAAEIYGAWVETFRHLQARTPHLKSTAAWLASFAERRVAGDDPMWSRSPEVILLLQIPFWINAGSIRSILQCFNFSYTDEGKLVYLESKRREIVEAVTHYMLGMQPAFVCPQAIQDGGCPAQSDACFKGITRLRELPASEECMTRAELRQMYFDLGGLPLDESPSWL